MARSGRPLVDRVTVECAGGCGNMVTRRASDYAKLTSGRVFCGADCRKRVGTKPRRGEDRPCERCGTEFYAPPHTVGRFCSNACHNEAQKESRVTLTCEVCGGEFSLGKAASVGRSTCSRACDTLRRTTNGVGRLHNGRPAVRDAAGYIRVWQPDHPKAFKNGWVLEHRLVVEQREGRYLETNEHVHHINGQKWDNRSENLALLGHSEHSIITAAERRDGLAQMAAELAEYRRRYGPLT